MFRNSFWYSFAVLAVGFSLGSCISAVQPPTPQLDVQTAAPESMYSHSEIPSVPFKQFIQALMLLSQEDEPECALFRKIVKDLAIGTFEQYSIAHPPHVQVPTLTLHPEKASSEHEKTYELTTAQLEQLHTALMAVTQKRSSKSSTSDMQHTPVADEHSTQDDAPQEADETASPSYIPSSDSSTQPVATQQGSTAPSQQSSTNQPIVQQQKQTMQPTPATRPTSVVTPKPTQPRAVGGSRGNKLPFHYEKGVVRKQKDATRQEVETLAPKGINYVTCTQTRVPEPVTNYSRRVYPTAQGFEHTRKTSRKSRLKVAPTNEQALTTTDQHKEVQAHNQLADLPEQGLFERTYQTVRSWIQSIWSSITHPFSKGKL